MRHGPCKGGGDIKKSVRGTSQRTTASTFGTSATCGIAVGAPLAPRVAGCRSAILLLVLGPRAHVVVHAVGLALLLDDCMRSAHAGIRTRPSREARLEVGLEGAGAEGQILCGRDGPAGTGGEER